MKKFVIRELKDGINIEEVFVLKLIQGLVTKTNKEYTKLTFTDTDKDIVGILWDVKAEDFCKKYKQGDLVVVKASISSFNNNLQCNKPKIRPFEGCNPYELSDDDISEAKERLLHRINLMQNVNLRAKIFELSRMNDYAFYKIPAAMYYHHTHIGGLADHTLEMMDICIKFNETIPSNLDLMLAGCFFHDYGKVEVYKMHGLATSFDKVGIMTEHIIEGCKIIQSLTDVSHDKKMLLQHIVASHHGELEFGAAVKPACIEALLVHYADKISADMNVALNATEEPDGELTTKIFQFGRQFFTREYIDKIMKG